MTTEITPLDALKLNEANPRTITPENFSKLITSLLVFPKMLAIRPIVVDAQNVVLGGNMRYQALQAIAQMTAEELGRRLLASNDFQKLDAVHQEKLIQYWGKWLDKPTAEIVHGNLTDSEAQQFIIKDNAAFGAWDFDMLANLFDETDLDAWGLHVWQPEDITSTDAVEQPGATDNSDDPIVTDDTEDEFSADVNDVPARVKPGEIWALGTHRLMCGDSLKDGDVAALMDGDVADLVFTDPPYGMGKAKDGVQNDNLYNDKLLEFNKVWIALSFKYLKAVGSWYCWGIEQPLMDIYAFILKPMIKANDITYRNTIIWDKGNAPGMNSPLMRQYVTATERCLFVMKGVQGFNNNQDFFYEPYEPIRQYLVDERNKMDWSAKDVVNILGKTTATHYFSRSQWALPTHEHYEVMQTAAKGQAFAKSYKELRAEYDSAREGDKERQASWRDTRAYFDNTHDVMHDVWNFKHARFTDYDDATTNEIHATPKPLALCARGIISSSRPGEIVLDMFGGSGSTLIACERNGRQCRMLELDPKYCDLIIARWEKETGKKAERITTKTK